MRIGEVIKHPNADTLSITNVHGGYPCIIRTGDFKQGDLAVYVPIDSLVPVAMPCFSFLAGSKGKERERVKAKKLRGIFSMGLLVELPVTLRPGGWKEGDDVAEALNVTKYLPPSESEPAAAFATTRKAKRSEVRDFTEKAFALAGVGTIGALLANHGVVGIGASLACFGAAYASVKLKQYFNTRPNYPTYDIEGIRKHKGVFEEGEPVVITEKIHGCNASFVWYHGKLHCKSRTIFRNERDVWWDIAKKYDLANKLKYNPGMVLYGEIYGHVQDLHYGLPHGQCDFVAFDVMNLETRQYLDYFEFFCFCTSIGVPVAPRLHYGPWKEDLVSLAEGPSRLAYGLHVREGIVIKPLEEQQCHLGRKILKLAGQGYLLRDENENNRNWGKRISESKAANA